MKNPLAGQHRPKPRPQNLSLTSPQSLTISQQTPSSNPLHRYRRSSLPNSIGHTHTLGQSINIRNSYEQPTTDIYFNVAKKSKFMKEIVDNYFQDTLQKIYGNQRELQGRERLVMKRDVRNFVKKTKGMFASITDNGHNHPVPKKQKQKHRQKQKQQPKHPTIEQTTQSQPEPQESITSSSNTFSFLPPIYESHEDAEELGKIFPEMAETSLEIGRAGDVQKMLSFQNQAFRIYTVLENGEARYRVKEFKGSGMEILKREQRALKFGVERIWKQSQINANSFISQLVQPLKNLITKITPHTEGTIKFKIRSTPYRNYLLANQCLELKNFIRDICAILKKIEGRVLNNKINPSNIFILKGNRVCIGQWGYSSFRDKYQIQDNKFQSRLNPILKSSKEWLATPEYLSPELLEAVLARSDEQQPDIWQQKSSSDIWSLGITLFQILTMIPIWMHEVCLCKLKTRKPVIRAGLLGTQDRKLVKIYEKQRKIEKSVALCLESQVQEGVSKEIVDLVGRMVVYDASERISLDQIMAIIK